MARFLLLNYYAVNSICLKPISFDFYKFATILDLIQLPFLMHLITPRWNPCFLLILHLGGVISYIYNPMSEQLDISLDFLKSAWEEDLGISLMGEQWIEALEGVHTASICTRHGLVQFRVLHRLHLSKVKLSKMYPNIDPLCDRCGVFPASLGHMFWLCPKLSNFWNSIFKTLSDILGHMIEPGPVLAVFGVPGEDSPLRGLNSTVARFITLLARRLILLNWKQTQPPTHTALVKDVMQHLKLEKLRFTLRGSIEKFHKTWQPFIDYVEARQ